MKKIFALALLCTARLFSQDYDYARVDLPRLDRMDNFYEFRDEVLPADLSDKLEDVRRKSSLKYIKLNEVPQGGRTLVQQYYGSTLIMDQSYDKKGLPEGMANLYYANGQVRQEIPFVKGMANGLGKSYDKDGTLMVETTYKNNKRHGLRKMHSRRGQETIEGNFDNDNVTGTIKVADRYGKTYVYPPDLKKGMVTVFENNIKVAEIPIIAEDKVHGEIKEFWNNGKVKSITRYYGGERHGLSEYFKPDGTPLFGNTYSNGKNVGAYTFLALNGTIMQKGQYDDNGQKTGPWVNYDKSGKPEREIEYKADKINGLYKSYYNGMLREETSYVMGKKEGLSNSYDGKTGALAGRKRFKNDEMQSYHGYYANGNVFSIYEYTGKEKPTSVKYYDHNLKMIHESKYNENGYPIGEHKLIMMEGNTYRIASVTTYDDNGKRIKLIMYSGTDNTSYMETYFDGETMHGPQTTYNAVTGEKSTKWYFKKKEVTEKEFKELSKKKP
jgi:antitoxin component YwqK of YwqJK toxin-antitoxin module